MNRVRILLADDHVEFSNVVEEFLEKEFDVVGKVGDGEALVTAALKLRPDIILTDISMPILNGIEATRKLRQVGVQARVVFLTLHSGDDFVQACLEAGASGYVLKIRLNTDLMPALHQVIQGRTFVLAPAGIAN
jgi:two-component system response regulator NreC